MQEPTQLSFHDVEGIVQDAVIDAVSFVEEDVMLQRIKAQRYFDGDTDLGYEEGRSKVVSTKVRDTIRGIKPSLMRVFLSNDKFVEYVPKRQEHVAGAEQATQYVHWAFNEAGGYNVLNDAFHDAMLKKCGIVKVYWDTWTEAETFTHTNLSEDQYISIVNEDDVEVLEMSMETEMSVDEAGLEVELPVYSVKISKTREEGKLCVEGVPPEEFFVNSYAKSIDDARIVVHRTEMTVGELVGMGYDWEKVAKFGSFEDGSTVADEEKRQRHGDSALQYDSYNGEVASKPVTVTEAYMKLDVNGTGIPVMHKILMGGTGYELLDYEEWGMAPFAVFEVDPEPHAFFGRSIADLVMNEQDACTSVLRGILDNVALTNNPRKKVIEDKVHPDDILNNEIGALIRVKSMDAIQEELTTFIAHDTLNALHYLDSLTEQKTGVTKASMGLDPDALQNTTATGAQLTASAGAGHVEVMARNLAESGGKRLFKLILRSIKENSPDEQMMRVTGRFLPINVAAWDASMDVSVNVGLGTGKDEMKLAVLNQTLERQQAIYMQYGPGNHMVSLTQIRNTLGDILALGGIRNSDRYYKPVDANVERQIMLEMQQQAQAQPPQPDQQAQAYIAGAQIKAQSDIQREAMRLEAKQQSDGAKLQVDSQLKAAEQNSKQGLELAKLRRDYEELRSSDDLERDRMLQELVLEAGRIVGQYGTAVDVERVRTLQAAPRDMNGNII